MTIERLAVSDYQARKDLIYLDVLQLHELYEDLIFRSNVILSGPKGIGKSLSIASFASKYDIPLITFDCSEDVRRSHLIGMFILRGNETPFILGPLTTAFEIANEVGRCILALEEINSLTPQMQKVLNPVSDFRKKIEVPEAKKVFQLLPDKKLWVVGTQNTAAYGGVYQLNEDLKSRFRIFPLNYPAPKDEMKIIETIIPSGDIDTHIIESVIVLAHETRQKSLEYSLSTRDIIQILEDISFVGLEKALWIATGKFEGEDQATLVTRIQSIFGISLFPKK